MNAPLLALGIFAAISLSAYAGDPATARYASAQLGVAIAELKRAREAGARGDELLAEQLATQARLDARLAWSMSNSPALRLEAAQIHRRAAAFGRSLREDAPGTVAARAGSR